MIKEKLTKFITYGFLLLPLMVMVTDLHARKSVSSGAQTAGFVIAADDSVDELIIHYQRDVLMLAGIDDGVSMRIYASGRVLVHYPVYMKRAGDYQMQLDDEELITLIQSLSMHGVLDFDEKKVKEKIRKKEKSRRMRGEVFVISDAVDTRVDITLDEYQENSASKKIIKFQKRFNWRNIEQDAQQHKDLIEITGVYKSIQYLKLMMKDNRLLKVGTGEMR